jgi:hypothetical protein
LSLARCFSTGTKTLILILILLILPACQTGPIVVVATPAAPDAGYHTYRHPSGVFSIRLPADWSIRDVSRDSTLRVEFSPPANDGLPVTVFIVNTGAVLDTATFLNLIDQYQKAFNGDPAQYREVARNAQGDGSWRIVGARNTPIGERQLNAFFQADKTFLSVIEADVTNNIPERIATLRNVINTYRVDSSAILSAGVVAPDPAASSASLASGSIAFDSLLEWADATGGWNINGQLTNTSSNAIEAIRITALLYDAQGRVLAEQPDVIPGDILPAGDTTPFTLRFRNGKPPQAVRYELQASARNAEYNLSNYIPQAGFIKGNEEAKYNLQGFLTVSGDIVNSTQQPAKFIRVTVTVFDDQNRVVGAESAFVQKPELLPGEVSKYEVTFFQLAGNANRFVTKVEGRVN